MAGDFISSPDWRGIARIDEAIENMVEHGFPPAAVERAKKMVSAFRHAEREWGVLCSFVQHLESCRSGCFWESWKEALLGEWKKIRGEK